MKNNEESPSPTHFARPLQANLGSVRPTEMVRPRRPLRCVAGISGVLVILAGCAGGPYDSGYGYNNGNYNGAGPQVLTPGTVMPQQPVGVVPSTPFPPQGTYLPQGTNVPGGSVLPPGNVLPPNTALPTSGFPAANGQNLPYGYPIGTDLSTIPGAMANPSLATPAPGLAPQYGTAVPQAYTAGVPLNQLYPTRAVFDFR